MKGNFPFQEDKSVNSRAAQNRGYAGLATVNPSHPRTKAVKTKTSGLRTTARVCRKLTKV